MEVQKMTVQELWEANHILANQCLLGTNEFDWWSEYEANHAIYDNYFRRIYAPFRYLDGESLTDFKYDVQAILFINKKKYEELYRIYTVSDDVFGVATNYDMTEIMARNTSSDAEMITGQRTDIVNNQTGSQNFSNVNKVTAYNSANENTKDSNSSSTGSRQDINQFTKGQESDTSRALGTENYTLTRKGNIGVKDSADILRNASDFIQSGAFEFYKIVFADIYKELLLV